MYRRKGPIREFTDDYPRRSCRRCRREEAWRALEPLTQLGIALGELDAEIDIPEPIDLLGIPAGRINVQRLFYWHVAKMFYRPDLTLRRDEPHQFRLVCASQCVPPVAEEVRRGAPTPASTIEREVVEEAGITVVARRRR